MKRTLLNPIFLIAVALASINQLLEKVFGIYVPIIHSFLDDLLCFPILLTVGLAAYRYFLPSYRLSGWHIWPVVIIYSIYFEVHLPRTSSVYTSDIIDVLMYVLGGLIFQRYINRSGPDLQAASLQNS